MKRIALAAAVALSVTALGVGPAAANGVNNPDSSTTVAVADSTTPAGDNAADDSPGGGESSPPSEDPSEEPSDKPSEDPSDQPGDDANGEPSEEPSEDPTEDPTDNPGEEVDPIEASMTVLTKRITESELVDPKGGIRYQIDGVKKGDVVGSDEGSEETTVKSDGTFEGTMTGHTEVPAGTVLDFSVTVSREGTSAKSLTGSVEVIKDEENPKVDPALRVLPERLPLDDFVHKGVKLEVEGCEAGSDVKFRVATVERPDIEYWSTVKRAIDDGTSSAVYATGEIDDQWALVGKYQAEATCGGTTVKTNFTVTPDGDDPGNEALSVSPKTIAGADFVDKEKGVTATAKNCQEIGDMVHLTVRREDSEEILYDEKVKVGETGDAALSIYGLQNRPDAYVGTYTVSVTCSTATLDDQFTVSSDGSSDDEGGQTGSGSSGEAGSLPRTGAEMTGLGVGVGLMLLGAAAIVLARMRSRSGE